MKATTTSSNVNVIFSDIRDSVYLAAGKQLNRFFKKADPNGTYTAFYHQYSTGSSHKCYILRKIDEDSFNATAQQFRIELFSTEEGNTFHFIVGKYNTSDEWLDAAYNLVRTNLEVTDED